MSNGPMKGGAFQYEITSSGVFECMKNMNYHQILVDSHLQDAHELYVIFILELCIEKLTINVFSISHSSSIFAYSK